MQDDGRTTSYPCVALLSWLVREEFYPTRIQVVTNWFEELKRLVLTDR